MNDLVLLATLLDGPKHGYALKKQSGLFSGQHDMHNNLVYPLLRRFVDNGWVSKRRTSGHRGQTRDVYSITPKGKQEVIRRAASFSEKEAASSSELAIRVGLFEILSDAQRLAILNARDAWLDEWEQKSERIRHAMATGFWGGQTLRFLDRQRLTERDWIASLKRKLKKQQAS